MNIEIQNEANYPVNAQKLQAAIKAVLKVEEVEPESAVTVVITSDEAIIEMNTQYRGIHAPTDILSFPADEPPIEEPDEPPYLGDLVIAFPYARAQAEREKHALDDSLSLLVVHGTLHLLGYDHDTPENKLEMWSVQAEVLTSLGISPEIVPALEGDDDDEA